MVARADKKDALFLPCQRGLPERGETQKKVVAKGVDQGKIVPFFAFLLGIVLGKNFQERTRGRKDSVTPCFYYGSPKGS